MANDRTATEIHRVDPVLAKRLGGVYRICLATASLVAASSLVARTFPRVGEMAPTAWTPMAVNSAVASLACAASMAISLRQRTRASNLAIRMLALLGALPLLADLAAMRRTHPGIPAAATVGWAHSTYFSALAFALLGLVLMLRRAERRPSRYVADLALFALLWVVLVIVSAKIFGALRVFEIQAVDQVSMASVCALPLLAFVAFGLRAEFGVSEVLLGTGLGSRMARGLTPLLLILPFIREAGRARLIRSHFLPEEHAAAVLASAAAIISIGLLILISRHIRRMEEEIRELTLRDELTGVHNLRGFRLFAEQSLRLAQRSGMPFSVLFVDVDGLKQINDRMGHGAGSALLVDTARLLQSTFRETDVIGRIGGDEFAVAGQFDQEAIERAAMRVGALAFAASEDAKSGARLSVSVGHVTTEQAEHESLTDLLEKADAAMYAQKRRKKLEVV